MFNLFKKKTAAVSYKNFVWIEEEAKYLALAQTVQLLQGEEEPTVIISFFLDTHIKLESSLRQSDVKFQLISDSTELLPAPLVFLGQATALESKLAALSNLLEKQSVKARFIFAEHYPALNREQMLNQKIFELFPESEIAFYTALREPFFTKFGAERIISLIQSMGMKENEMLSHSMIDKSIINAQKKIQDKISQELRANSQQAWLTINGL